MTKILSDSLEIVDAFNGYYLYGQTPDGEAVFLGCLGDGCDHEPSLDDMPDYDWAEAYGFEIA